MEGWKAAGWGGNSFIRREIRRGRHSELVPWKKRALVERLQLWGSGEEVGKFWGGQNVRKPLHLYVWLSSEIKERKNDIQKKSKMMRVGDGNHRRCRLMPSASNPHNANTLRAPSGAGYHARCVEKRGSKESIYHIAHRPAMPKSHFMAHQSFPTSHTH